MSLALIEESAKEVRRLAIAGSPLAVGDFRIKKLVPPLEQAGAKVSVFAQVAKAINDLVNGTEAESAARLLALSTLLNAILYTQGQTTVAAPFTDLEIFAANCTSTRTTARALKPLIVALTTAGAGRLETVRSASERGALNDLRLIDPAIHALGDSYPEMADLVAEKILPAYGPGIAPRLKTGLNLKGNKSDARRLKILHRLDPAGTVELCKTALDDGAPEVKAAAIVCLGQHEECLSLVMEQANAKNKIVRAAALEALAEHDRPEIVKLFSDLIKSDALGILARPFRAMRNRSVLNSLISEGRRVFEEVIKSGKEDQLPRFLEILECLKGRSDDESENFILACFSRSEKLGKLKIPVKSPVIFQFAGIDVMDRLAWTVYQIGSPKALDAILAKRESLPPTSFLQVLHSALRRWPKEKVFGEFAPLLEQTKGPGKIKREIIQQSIRTASLSHVMEPDGLGADHAERENLARVQWDPRWLDAAIKANQQDIVCCLARPDHEAVINYLLKAVESKTDHQTGLVVRALIHCEYSKATDVFLDAVSAKTKTARYFDYGLQLLFNSARHLRSTDLPKLDAFAAKLDEKFVDKYLEALEPLRTVNQPNQT